MPNDYFSFKQFTIQQEKCAMKVCTDACILGAWTAGKLQHFPSIQTILDIGCGTGLLSLMLAQKTSAHIDAVEIDADAANQAKENVDQSPWKERINVIHNSIQDFTPETTYDLIISNPPFFEDDLRSPDKSKNDSKHDTSLKLDELVDCIKKNLSNNGIAAVLIPFHRTDHLAILIKERGLHIIESLFIKQTPSHHYFRSIILFSEKSALPIEINELTIHDADRNYTEAFSSLLKDYYLKL